MKKSPIKNIFRFILILFILVAMGIIALLFTNYKGYGDKIKSMVIPEPIVAADSIRGDVDVELDKHEEKDSSIFKFNTHYDKIETDSLMVSDTIASVDEQSESLISEVSGDTKKVDSISVIQVESSSNDGEGMVESKSKKDLDEPSLTTNSKSTELDATSRIIAISAKNLLLNNNRDDQEAIIVILSESSQINSISILDASNKVIFSTDQKNLGKTALAFIGQEPNSDKMKCIDNDLTCILPIYHTFGKLGYAVVRRAR